MESLKKYLKDTKPEQYHIFDSHQEKMVIRGVSHKDSDYVAYSYNIHKNNKPKAGDLFLYRRPGKSTANRKFNIYGGGVIDSITEPDKDGNVLAIIKLPFKFKNPLEQSTSDFLENFVWTSKKKEPGSWAHFWNQYGMNLIDEHDFWGLVDQLDFTTPINTNTSAPTIMEATEEFAEVSDKLDIDGFELNIENEEDQKTMPTNNIKKTRKLTGTHIDYKELQKTKSSIGKAGEYLVLEMLREQFDGQNVIIEHVAESEGDGLGYDIRLTFPNKRVTYIEVKTTNSAYIDGFYITPCELNVAQQCQQEENSKWKSYDIYRVYNFDPKKKTANIKVFEHFNADEFKLAPTSWKVISK